MSLYGALRSGVSGLFANSQRMGMISDNIANVNTTGYKRVDARFSTFVTGGNSGTGAYSSGGVVNYNSREIGQQGGIEPTAFTTDMAISGNGYFIVSREVQRASDGEFTPVGDTFFTRSGEFRVNNDGNLRNSEGYYLLSWPPNETNTDFIESNEFGSMVPVNVGNQSFDPEATTNFDLGVNLVPTTELGSTNAFSVTQEIIDRQGRARTLTLNFEKMPSAEHNIYFSGGGANLDKISNIGAPNSWRVYASVEDASVKTYNADGSENGLTTEAVDVPIADVVFDSTGRLTAVTPPGSVNLYYRTQLPLSYDNIASGGTITNELGSVPTARYNLDAAAITQPIRNQIRVVLNDSGQTIVPTPTSAQIRAGIDSLDTEEFPLAMGQIMSILNGVVDFDNNVARANAGLPALDEGIDELFALSFDSPTAGATDDPGAGTVSLGSALNSTEYMAGRIINNDGDVLRTVERTIGGTSYTRLQQFTSAGNDKLRLTLDFDNSTATQSDVTDVDINLGTLTLNAFSANDVLNRSTTRITTVGTGMQGNDGVTQYDDSLSTLRFTEHNGRRFSALQSVDIADDGVVQGFYDNGETRNLFKIPLVTFANPNGLKAASGNVFEETNESGIALTRVANSSGAGQILSSAREAAAVDLAEEFSNMIITQRAYSAATKIITTTDSMLDELTRSIR